MPDKPAASEGEALRQAARAYAEAAFAFLNGKCAQTEALVSRLPVWKRSAHQPDCFEIQGTEFSAWSQCIYAHGDALHALPQWSTWVSELQHDPVIARQLETTVGTPLGLGHMSTAAVTDRILLEIADERRSATWDSEAFERAFGDFDRDLHRSEVEVVLIAPLLAPTIEGLPLLLRPGVSLAHLNDDEIHRALSARVLISSWGESTPYAKITSDCAVRVEYRLPRCIEEESGQPSMAAITQQRQAAALAEVEAVFRALRLFHDGTLRRPGHLVYADDWPMSGGHGKSTGLQLPLEPTMSLSSDKMATFEHFFHTRYELLAGETVDEARASISSAIATFADAQDWFELYKAYELVRRYAGNQKQLDALAGGRSARSRFTRSVDEHRHAHGTRDPHPNPMTYGEADAFVRGLIQQAIDDDRR